MLITRKSPFTGIIRTFDLNITDEQMKRYEDGALIQHAFPHLNADQREFIMTGISPKEWDDAFKIKL